VHLLFRILLHPEHGLSQQTLTLLWLSAGALAAAAGLGPEESGLMNLAAAAVVAVVA
jgi:hypothetical protein